MSHRPIAKHPFYIENVGFVEAEDITIGDPLRLASGKVAVVELVEKEIQEELEPMYNLEIEEFHTYYVGTERVLVHNTCGNGSKGEANTQGNGVPVKEKTKASNGLDYQSNPKHTSGQSGNRPNAGIEPKNSLDLFGESLPSTSKPNQRFTYDVETNTLHRFYNDGNGTWHWSGSTNQGVNSITDSQVPNDIKNTFGLPKKGW